MRKVRDLQDLDSRPAWIWIWIHHAGSGFFQSGSTTLIKCAKHIVTKQCIRFSILHGRFVNKKSNPYSALIWKDIWKYMAYSAGVGLPQDGGTRGGGDKSCQPPSQNHRYDIACEICIFYDKICLILGQGYIFWKIRPPPRRMENLKK